MRTTPEPTEYEQHARDSASVEIAHRLEIARARAEAEARAAGRIADLEAQVSAMTTTYDRHWKTVAYIATESKGPARIKLRAIREHMGINA